ncbi:ParA family protein [Nocardiopsis baichengensis]|uniref:ParA family protein n=1 Tax=Nocardiopsis baichengensis TaxID=280240 RepID=UPI0003498737|nr:AAA family ATPase [Nocardiopsis baichengensis]
MTSIALFNIKDGVRKTTLAYHLAHMYQRRGKRVLAVDLDPQSNLTSAFLDEDDLAFLWDESDPSYGSRQEVMFTLLSPGTPKTIVQAVQPIVEGTGDVELIEPAQVAEGLWLLPGDLELSRFEDELSQAWGNTLAGNAKAVRATTAFYRVIQNARRVVDPDVVLIDIGPNLGAINRAALLSSDTVLMPLAADLFSLRGLRNLGPTLAEWRGKWQGVVVHQAPRDMALPSGNMSPLGYVIMQPGFRLDRPVGAYKRWLDRIPMVYERFVLEESGIEGGGDHEIATIRQYRSLMPLAHDARKPMFDLRTADGAMGSMQGLVEKCRSEFRDLTYAIDGRLAALRERRR